MIFPCAEICVCPLNIQIVTLCTVTGMGDCYAEDVQINFIKGCSCPKCLRIKSYTDSIASLFHLLSQIQACILCTFVMRRCCQCQFVRHFQGSECSHRRMLCNHIIFIRQATEITHGIFTIGFCFCRKRHCGKDSYSDCCCQ